VINHIILIIKFPCIISRFGSSLKAVLAKIQNEHAVNMNKLGNWLLGESALPHPAAAERLLHQEALSLRRDEGRGALAIAKKRHPASPGARGHNARRFWNLTEWCYLHDTG
jgi:hypothetical protein